MSVDSKSTASYINISSTAKSKKSVCKLDEESIRTITTHIFDEDVSYHTRPKDDEIRNDDHTKVYRCHDDNTQTTNSAESESTILQLKNIGKN